ncbi:MAG: GDSL-type esterase/lipase family protein [Nostocaceae cyanobacterium]|nr:GDSL-type esterase/lipase family protein [Nostocaceae cyanobacterium]
MRDICLLTVGVLTGLTIPTFNLQPLSIVKADNSPMLSDVTKDSQPQINQKIASAGEISLPESSNRNLRTSNKTSRVISRQVFSGSQMYYQRLTALKAGQIYTRWSDDSWYPLWVSASKRRFSYQDWKILLALEARAIAKGQGDNRLSILLGDSLSMWFPTTKLPDGQLWLNQGISGDTSGGILSRLSAFSRTRPHAIYIMAGINDLRRGLTDEVILRNHRLIIRRLRRTHPQTQIIIQSILPTRRATLPNGRIRKLNQKLAAIAQQEGASYQDIHRWFTDSQGNLRRELTTDGLHLSANGYEVWRTAIRQIEYKLTISKISNVLK